MYQLNFMKRLLIIPVCVLVLSACSRNNNTPVPAQPVPNQPTTDFREAYTGDFLVDIAIHSGLNLYNYYDTARNVRVRFSYTIADTVKYYIRAEVISSMPAISMVPLDSMYSNPQNSFINSLWGMRDTLPGKLVYSESNAGGNAWRVMNTGGFYGIDSINFLHEYYEPKISRSYSIRGKRIK